MSDSKKLPGAELVSICMDDEGHMHVGLNGALEGCIPDSEIRSNIMGMFALVAKILLLSSRLESRDRKWARFGDEKPKENVSLWVFRGWGVENAEYSHMKECTGEDGRHWPERHVWDIGDRARNVQDDDEWVLADKPDPPKGRKDG